MRHLYWLSLLLLSGPAAWAISSQSSNTVTVANTTVAAPIACRLVKADLSTFYDASGGAGGAGDASAANQVLQTAKLTTMDATLTLIKGGTDKIPSSPAAEHTTAASPNSCRLSDGAAFITTLPVSLASMPALAAGSAVIGHVINDASSAVIGHVIADSGSTTAVTGTVAANATLSAETTKVIGTVNIASSQTVGLVAGSAIVGKVGIDQTTPGTTNAVQANAGTNLNTSALALDATLTGGTQQTKITDGTNVATVKAASTAAVAADKAVVVAVSPNNAVALAAGSAVIGHVIADSGSTTAVTGTVTTNSTLSAETTKVIGTVNVAASQTIGLAAGSAKVGQVAIDQTTPGTTNLVQVGGSLPAGTNRIGSARLVDSADADLTAAKGSQTSRAVGTQDLKDSGRTQLRFYFNAVASGTTGTETAITMTKSSGTAATSTAASFVITSGKTMRITSVTFGSRGHLTATAQITNCRIRVNTGGAVITSSTPVIYDLATATPATALAWDRATIQGLEGDEIAGNGTIQFGVTCAAVFVTNAPTWFGMITAYEY
jgi:hypothetical protein